MATNGKMRARHLRAIIGSALTAALTIMMAFALSLPITATAETTERVASDAADELGSGFRDAMLDVSLAEDCDIKQEDAPSGNGYTAKLLTSADYKKLMDYALQYKGLPYVWGGKYPSQGGFDCSGLVTWCYNNALGATMDGWYTNAARIYNDYCDYLAPQNATPGDLVFWRGTYGSDINYISHVGIYCGDNLAYAAGDPIGYCQIDHVKNVNDQPAQYFFGSLREADDKMQYDGDDAIMYRMYNRITGEHLYTSSTYERNSLMKWDWDYEGVGWIAPKNGRPVYRLYNPALGDHHYTTSSHERDSLVNSHGWSYEGIGWYSGGSIPLYRQYNPGLKIGQHNYTANKDENDILCARYGWQAEGIGWYGVG